jgi:cell fate regulator YaaT (PSP1 superfamily)
MGCAGCNTGKDGVPSGCGSKGHCTSGGCNKMNTFDWLSNLDIQDPSEYQYMEVSFKNGARKDFYKMNQRSSAMTGDMVVVEASNGYDVGRVSLSGELVRLQMKKKRVNEDRVVSKVIRVANDRDLEKLEEARSKEQKAMVRARVIARLLGLQMKIGDVEYQGDNRKATFYYTADGRIDFRELVRSYANEFRVKIEMRQIGSRQESGRIGGMGPCGRELCCSTWLSNFKSVSTSAARYQNLAINQTKLSGQCGRLKCCLNYELDSYLDALDDFPKRADVLKTADYRYELLKTDIFKGIMYYIQKLERGRGPVIAINKDRVKEVLAMNKKGEFPEDLGAELASIGQESDDMEYADLTGFIELPTRTKRKKRGGRDNRKNRGRGRSRGNSGNSRSKQKDPEGKSSGGNDSRKSSNNKPKSKSNKRRNYKSSKGKPNNRNDKKD